MAELMMPFPWIFSRAHNDEPRFHHQYLFFRERHLHLPYSAGEGLHTFLGQFWVWWKICSTHLAHTFM